MKALVKYVQTSILAVFFLSFCSFAMAEDEIANEADHEQLRKLKGIFEKAINENNLELLRPHMHETFSFVTLTRKEFKDFDSFKTQWEATRKKMLNGGTYTVKLDPDRSEIYENIAITKGRSNNVMVTGDGDRYEFTENWTAICRKINGKWKIVRAHSSIDPFFNPMVKAQFKKMSIKVGLMALLVGLIIGFGIKMFISRKKKIIEV